MISIKKHFLWLLIATGFFSCKKDLDEIKKLEESKTIVVEELKGDYVAPLFNTRTTLGEVFKYSEVKKLTDDLYKTSKVKLSIRPDGVFEMDFEADYKSEGFNKYYKIPNTEESIEFTFPPNVLNAIDLLPIGQSLDGIFDTTVYFDIEPNYGGELELIEFGAGNLNLDFNHNLNQNLGLRVDLLSIFPRGERDPSKNIPPVNFTSPNKVTIPLGNKDALLSDQVGAVTNYNRVKIRVRSTGTVTNNIVIGNKMTLKVSSGDYFFKYIQGYLGEFTEPLPSGTWDINVFDEFGVDGFYFKEPSANFNIKSTIGSPISMLVNKFNFKYAGKDSVERVLVPSGTIYTINPIEKREFIPTSPRETKIDIGPSVVSPLLTEEPKKVLYNFSMVSNLQTGTDRHKFFVADTSNLSIKANFKVPMNFSVFNYQYSDTIFLDTLVSKEDRDTVKKLIETAQLKLIFETQLPFDVEVNGILYDKDYKELGKLFDNPIKVLANDQRDADGNITSVRDQLVLIDIDQKKFDLFGGAYSLIITGNGKTSEATNDINNLKYVKMKENYIFGIRAGIRVKTKVNAEIDKEDSDNPIKLK